MVTEKEGEFVAQFKSTVAIFPSKVVVLAGALPFDEAKLSNATIKGIKDEELKKKIVGDLWAIEKKKK